MAKGFAATVLMVLRYAPRAGPNVNAIYTMGISTNPPTLSHQGYTYAKTCAHQRHGTPPLLLTTNIRRNSRRNLDIPLRQPANDPARQEGPEIGGQQPEQHRGYVPAHGDKERFAAAVLVGKDADDGRGDGLEGGEHGAEGSAQEDNVIPAVDGSREGVFVGVEGAEDLREEGVGCG